MLYITIDRNSNLTMTRQLYQQLKAAIMNGTILPDQKLPSTRELSADCHVARNVVIEGYEQLIAEGYAYSKGGSGTYAAKGVQYDPLHSTSYANTKSINNINSQNTNTQTINTRSFVMGACESGSFKAEQHETPAVSFRTGVPDLNQIPIRKWAQTYHAIALDLSPKMLDYQDPMGTWELRAQIAAYLNRVRGAQVRPECVLITSGAAQVFALLCQLVPKDKCVLVEHPMSPGVNHTLQANQLRMVAVEVDDNGLQVEGLYERIQNDPPSLIFTTPSHQFPTGAVLPAARRIELVQIAEKLGAYLVEDDYDSEFRLEGSPLQAMQFLNPERVIYIGTFSKTLMPAIRIGYMVLPACLLETMREAKYIQDIHSPVLEQLTLAEFLRSGNYDNHIRKMCKRYRKKRNLLIQSLQNAFGANVRIGGVHAGIHLTAQFKGCVFDETLMQKIQAAGVEISTIAYGSDTLLFGYGNTEEAKIVEGVALLHSVIDICS